MTQVFLKILDISLGASVLAILILFARVIIGKRSHFFMTILFALLIVKLVLPISIQSPYSIQNLFANYEITQVRQNLSIDIPQVESSVMTTHEKTLDSTTQAGDTNNPSTQTNKSLSPKVNEFHITIWEVLAKVWLAGVVLLSACIAINNILFRLRLQKNNVYDEVSFNKLIVDCKKDVGIKKNIPIILTNKVNTAAIYGAIRPILLISRRSFESLTMDERRKILMHELLHIKRRDTITSLLTIILNIIHWFNPILWITFILMRRDLEVMCDADVLKKIGQEHKHSYVSTLVKLIKLNPSKSSSPMTTLSVDSDIKRRITMISKQRKNTVLFTVISIIITTVIIITGCTTKIVSKESNQDLVMVSIDGEIVSLANDIEKTNTDDKPFNTTNKADLELIGTFSLEYDSEDKAMALNIKKACNILNGTVIPSEGIISLNEILGERAKDKGWKVDRKGGLCKFTSTLYNCVLRAELEIIDVSHHSISSSYISGGLDAMINYGTDDLVMRNPYDNDVKIIANANNDTIKIDIYGPYRDYTVDITSELIESGEVPEYEYKYNCDTLPNGDSIPKGESKIHIKPQPRQTFNIIKTLYDIDGNEIERSVIDTHTYNEHKGIMFVNAPTP